MVQSNWAPPPPPKTPGVECAEPFLKDAMQALERAQAAWRESQLLDALGSAKKFIAEAEDAVAAGRRGA